MPRYNPRHYDPYASLEMYQGRQNYSTVWADPFVDDLDKIITEVEYSKWMNQRYTGYEYIFMLIARIENPEADPYELGHIVKEGIERYAECQKRYSGSSI